MSETTVQSSQERQKVGMLIPPPILLVALVLASVAAHFLWLGWLAFSLPRVLAGALVLLASFSLVVASGRAFRQAGTPVRPTAPAVVVVVQGPYRISRNPMYVGMAGALAGLGVLTGSLCFALAFLVFLAIVHFGVVLPEERYLESLHGDAFRRYKQQVRRWL